LRFVASVGEPLAPEAVLWSMQALGHPIHDGWGQTETGGVMIANYRGMPVRPGSMGKPLPGVDVALVARRADGSVVPFTTPGVTGELALRPGWPAMFMGYLDDEPGTRRRFEDGWYFTGDLAQVDADGYFWFVGRAGEPVLSDLVPPPTPPEDRKSVETRLHAAALAEASP
jgi:acetyl-CoA synthetase